MNLKDYKFEFSNRLGEILGHYSMNAHSFEQRSGLKLGVIQKAISNKGTISAEAISKILLSFDNINAFWLLTGKENLIRKKLYDDFNVLHEDKAEYMSKSRLLKEGEIIQLKEIIDLQKYKIAKLEEELKKCKG